MKVKNWWWYHNNIKGTTLDRYEMQKQPIHGISELLLCLSNSILLNFDWC